MTGLRLDRTFAKFVAVSALQAIANYATYLIVLTAAPWWIAFAAAVVVGVALQTVLQIRATFDAELTPATSGRYIGYQLAYLVIFAALLSVTIAAGVHPAIAPLVVLVGLTPINFILSRWIISRQDPVA